MDVLATFTTAIKDGGGYAALAIFAIIILRQEMRERIADSKKGSAAADRTTSVLVGLVEKSSEAQEKMSGALTVVSGVLERVNDTLAGCEMAQEAKRKQRETK